MNPYDKHQETTLRVHKAHRDLWIKVVLDDPDSYCPDYVDWVQRRVNYLNDVIKGLEVNGGES